MSAIPTFSKYLTFGNHQLPLDTATSFRVYGGRDLDGIYSGYSLYVDFQTYRNEEPYGNGTFGFVGLVKEEVNGLMQQLVEQNIAWNLWIDEVRYSLQRKRIDLFYNAHEWMGKTDKGSDLELGDLYVLFREALGLPEGKIVKRNRQQHVIRMPLEKNEMKEKIFNLFCKKNENPIYEGPYFEVTKERIVAKRRVIEDLDPSWREEDIPYLIAQHLSKREAINTA